MIEVKVPEFGESIQEVQIAQWQKKVGEFIAKDEDLVELESEKASQALPSPESGIIKEILHEDGAFVQVGDVIARMEAADAPAASATPAATPPAAAPARVMPAAERLLHENDLSPEQVTATGPGGRLLKEDVMRQAAGDARQRQAPVAAAAPSVPTPASKAQSEIDEFHDELETLERADQIKPMSMIRRTIAKRLVEAQNQAALLTTFNEIDMQPVMELRSKYKEQFLDKHGVKLGFMSFFAKASVEALKRFPAINSQIDGNNVVYRNYCDVGIAIGGGKGLVVPILRSVERLSFAAIERTIGRFATLAQANKIKPEDLEGGTFTISNGGVYGSLLSTPIVNPPQSGILGLHSIQKRPVVVNDEIVIRPMMYVALTYDHRIVDGREAVQFLKTIKEVLEEPARLFLEV
ncbi:MAG: 2-oxoglutarate dehydrogenase complex dihydrolipoyllysine-residue succinyltransferase [Planctomycetaceae bacterium]|nr:2-oxoglutarate dehydrogenase complex dihydrolipoyllysine-residue succinyltransferase [Planctomycetaceae bacterium]MCP4464839.1 2-oxoglutarate dehydrogenase complex dihydrolipoyllysine-residue succinyltransferase [Planctomycetaceae bacterium]MDG1808781.1 2-oxoglutarate dehydrogenase complex dihydrolipoyllysine-residue succinyltransferase [Pirellulaceae bacterium]MDG2102837.1 2-oxoglutarate dehydrogenase complex dihydrolipoyllysine-residue succinyltransferase [Pirellulaceae bacterium]